jgi:hypothetical protein
MIKTIARFLCLPVVALSSAWFLACGGNGAANNDQGVSVTLLGFFSGTTGNLNGGGQQPTQNNCGGIPASLGRVLLRLGDALPETDSGSSSANGTDPSSSYVVAIGVQNNLMGQYYRGDRLVLDYYIPGSSLQPPSTNVALSIFAGPASSGSGSSGASGSSGGSGASGASGATGIAGELRRPGHTSLPPSFNNLCNQSYAVAAVIPASIREWLNFNRAALPEPPYSMEVYALVSGLSSSGNRYDTNTAVLHVDVLPETFVPDDNSAATTSASSVEASDTVSGASVSTSEEEIL